MQERLEYTGIRQQFLRKCLVSIGERSLGRWAVSFVLLRRDVDAWHLHENRVRRPARELRLRDRRSHEIRTVLPELQEGELHFQQYGLRNWQRVVFVRPLHSHEL
jgi:hypothetical protein